MQSMTIYIILGTLVMVVVIFLFATSVVDRRKQKKIKIKKQEQDEQKKVSGIKIAIILKYIINKNQYLLKTFVPSVGKLKMSQIKLKAIKSLLVLEKSNLFTLFQSSDFHQLIAIFQKFRKSNANIWKKKFVNETKVISDLAKSDKSIKAADSEIKKIIRKITKIYKNELTK